MGNLPILSSSYYCGGPAIISGIDFEPDSKGNQVFIIKETPPVALPQFCSMITNNTLIYPNGIDNVTIPSYGSGWIVNDYGNFTGHYRIISSNSSDMIQPYSISGTISITVTSNMTESPTKPIKSTGEIFQGELQFGICGENKNPKINGAGENPIVLKRSSGEAILPFCITQIDPNHIHWNLQVGYEPSFFPIKPQHDISVNLSQTSIDLSAIAVNSTNTPQFTATITADPSTKLGVHIFMISAMYPLESGAHAVLGKYCYVNIQS